MIRMIYMKGVNQFAIVFGSLFLHLFLLIVVAQKDSPTINEPHYLVAGLSIWEIQNYDLHRVNPPFIKLLASAPLYFVVDSETDWTHHNEKPFHRSVSHVATDFIAANQDQITIITIVSRVMCFPFSLLGGLICYLWARELGGNISGFIALLLWCSSPNILAHGHLVSADVAAASFGISAFYYFRKWLTTPTWSVAITSGVFLGLAETTKFTWTILYALWPLIWLGSYMYNRIRNDSHIPFSKSGVQLLLILVVAVYITNLFYLFSGSFKPLGDYQFVSRSLGGNVTETGEQTGNRFTDTLIGELPVPFPEPYITGIDIQKRDLEKFTRPSYLNGEFSYEGWWYYYLFALAVKMPLGTLSLLFIACWVFIRKKDVLPFTDKILLIVPPLLLLTVCSSQTGLNLHMRYILPIFPFMFIFIAAIIGTKLQSAYLWRVPIGVLLLATITSCLMIHPHYISYFNLLAGGPANGGNILLHSNIDWGQDLYELKEWLYNNVAEDERVNLMVTSSYPPEYLGIESIPPPTKKEIASGPNGTLNPGWYVFSVNYLYGYSRSGNIEDSYEFSYLKEVKPTARIGYSICIYYLTEENVKQIREIVAAE